jgi:hypothetical protein
VSTLMLKYSAAASRSSNRGPEPTRRDEDGRRDADKILGAGDAATGSVLGARALSGRHWPAVPGPPSVPTSSLIGFTVMSSSRRCSSSLAVRLCGSVSCHLIFCRSGSHSVAPSPGHRHFGGIREIRFCLRLRRGLRRFPLLAQACNTSSPR